MCSVVPPKLSSPYNTSLHIALHCRLLSNPAASAVVCVFSPLCFGAFEASEPWCMEYPWCFSNLVPRCSSVRCPQCSSPFSASAPLRPKNLGACSAFGTLNASVLQSIRTLSARRPSVLRRPRCLGSPEYKHPQCSSPLSAFGALDASVLQSISTLSARCPSVLRRPRCLGTPEYKDPQCSSPLSSSAPSMPRFSRV
ncbi:UNVERIFIED_CONTAM: hypothetical protein FKN15_047420 [Acipenser sinensis]